MNAASQTEASRSALAVDREPSHNSSSRPTQPIPENLRVEEDEESYVVKQLTEMIDKIYITILFQAIPGTLAHVQIYYSQQVRSPLLTINTDITAMLKEL